MTIRTARAEDVDVIAALHGTCIPEGFLVSLGPRFLRRLYARAVRSGRVDVLIAEGTDAADGAAGPLGFVAVADDVAGFYREFLLRDGLLAAGAAAVGILRAPRRVFETWRYGGRGAHRDPAAEILALAVAPAARGRGLGPALASAGVARAAARGVSRMRVLTAVGNEAAARAYGRAGLRRVGRDTVHRGIEQDVFEWP